MFICKLYNIYPEGYGSPIKVIYNYKHSINFIYDNESKRNIPRFDFDSKLYSTDSLINIIQAIHSNINDFNEISRKKTNNNYYESPNIYFMFIGSINGIIWNTSSMRDNYYFSYQFSEVDLDIDNDIINLYKTVPNNTLYLDKEFLLSLEKLYINNNKVINNDNYGSLINFDDDQIYYVSWLIKKHKLNNKRIIITNQWGFYSLNKVNLKKLKCFKIDSFPLYYTSLQKQKIMFIMPHYKLFNNYYKNINLNKEVDVYCMNPISDYGDNGNRTMVNFNRFMESSSFGSKQYYNPTFWQLRYINNQFIIDNDINMFNKLLGPLLLSSLVNCNYITMANFIIESSKYGFNLEHNFADNISDLELIYNSKNKLPIIFSLWNNIINIKSLANFFSYQMCEVLEFSNTKSYYNLKHNSNDFMKTYWLEPHQNLGYLSEFSNKINSSFTNINDYLNSLIAMNEFSFKFNELFFNKEIEAISNYSFNKVNQLASFLLMFMIDNEIDNYLDWSLILMSEKITIITDILNNLIKFRNLYSIEEKYIGLIYVCALAFTINEHNLTIKDICNNLINLRFDLNNCHFDNYCEYNEFESNLIKIYVHIITLDNYINKNYI